MADESGAAQWMIVNLPGATVADRRAAREATFNDLEQYVEDFPGNRRQLSIRLNLGNYYQRQARWSRALHHLSEAWAEPQDPTVPSGPRFADRAQVALGTGLLDLGRIEALEEGTSGFCLVPQGTLPVGWLLASPTQTAAVIGRSFATYRADAQDEQCPPPPPCCAVGQGGGAEGNADGNNCSGNGSAENNCFCLVAPCHCPGGLPHCRISKPFMNVWLEDEP